MEDFKIEDMGNALKFVKSGKTSGVYGILTELSKIMIQKLIDQYHIINSI